MSLTGTPFFVLTVVLVVVALAALFGLWNRIPGPGAARLAARFGLAVLSQLTAVVMVLVYLNNSMGPFYDSWSDLFGGSTTVSDTALSGNNGHHGGDGVAPGGKLTFSSYLPGVLKTRTVGASSGIEGSLYVWLPPQYHDPAYANTDFPVVELLPGTPGTPQAWFGTMKVQDEMSKLMAAGTVKPMIMVSAKLNVLGGNTDPGCADIPGVARTATWLSRDVPALIRSNFRAAKAPSQWAIMGYSAGAYCAVNLTVQHPDVFGSAVSLSGYNTPESPLVTNNLGLSRANDPVYQLKHAKKQPPVSFLMGGSLQDQGTVPAAKALLAVLRTPGDSRLVTVREGGHTPTVWREMLPDALTWLSARTSG
ncbi:alpha/beta hydrolase [Streptacidiphilus fuscans]|uniref:Esterase n=1 Tax=Streptacidiphilus fuscans TaxID=2789292 RepID=A0A931FJP6_9ACTN|nr:alpha/beta hydrolase-fold protein [Streptacidiphilus fuscans]MBF9072138.1 esterase [Streptacidiphilus fuscans]MBF9072949.1 esterase [Streptacidiphilus fuscans]